MKERKTESADKHYLQMVNDEMQNIIVSILIAKFKISDTIFFIVKMSKPFKIRYLN